MVGATRRRVPRAGEDQPAELAEVESCVLVAGELRAQVEQRLGDVIEKDADVGPIQSVTQLHRVLKQKAASIPKAPAPGPAKSDQPATADLRGAVEVPADPAQARAVFRAEFRPRLHELAGVLLAADPADSLPYRIHRFFAWGQVEGVKPEYENRLAIPGPEDAVGSLRRIDEKPDEAVWLAYEEEFRKSPYWLDLQHRLWRRMGTSGSRFEVARSVIRAELASLLARRPNLPELIFRTSTPVADEATRAWIQSEVLAGGAGTVAVAGDSADAVAEVDEKAVRLAKSGQIQDAVTAYTAAIAATQSDKEEFRMRLGFGRLCLDNGQPDLAIAQLQLLESMVQRHDLEAWEPSLCVDLWLYLYRSYAQLQKRADRPDATRAAAMDRCRVRLGQLDPVKALELGG